MGLTPDPVPFCFINNKQLTESILRQHVTSQEPQLSFWKLHPFMCKFPYLTKWPSRQQWRMPQRCHSSPGICMLWQPAVSRSAVPAWQHRSGSLGRICAVQSLRRLPNTGGRGTWKCDSQTKLEGAKSPDTDAANSVIVCFSLVSSCQTIIVPYRCTMHGCTNTVCIYYSPLCKRKVKLSNQQIMVLVYVTVTAT